jgi:hypothetical protein
LITEERRVRKSILKIVNKTIINSIKLGTSLNTQVEQKGVRSVTAFGAGDDPLEPFIRVNIQAILKRVRTVEAYGVLSVPDSRGDVLVHTLDTRELVVISNAPLDLPQETLLAT